MRENVLCRGFLPHKWRNDGENLEDYEDKDDPDWKRIYVRTRFVCERCGHVSKIALTYSNPPSRWTIYGSRL